MIVEALKSLRPGAQWSLNGDTVDGLVWLDQQQSRPSDAEIAAQVAALSGPSIEDVKTEAQRRIIAMTGVADIVSCLIKQMNANMRANELNNKLATGGILSADEQAEAAALQAYAVAIKAIRNKSNEIEAIVPIPDDYADDSRWP